MVKELSSCFAPRGSQGHSAGQLAHSEQVWAEGLNNNRLPGRGALCTSLTEGTGTGTGSGMPFDFGLAIQEGHTPGVCVLPMRHFACLREIGP